MSFKFIFDYENNEIRVQEGKFEENHHIIKNAVDVDGKRVIIKWGQTYALDFLLYAFQSKFNSYKKNALDYFVEEAESEKKKKYILEIASKVKKYINNNLLREFEFEMDDTYRLTDGVYAYDIEWIINAGSVAAEELMDAHCIYSTWGGHYTPMATAESREQTDGRGSDIKAGTTYKIGKTDKAIHWTDDVLKRRIEEGQKLKTLNKKLLPQVRTSGGTYTSLKDYICKSYIKEDQTQAGRSFGIIEGKMGSGKTSSLLTTADALREDEHITIMIRARDMFSISGKKSLFDCMAKYINGYEDTDNELRVRKLLSEEKRKIIIIIDGLDEAIATGYKTLAMEINKIGEFGNPNVYILLSTRNAFAFIKNSGIIGENVHFRRCENIYICDIDESSVYIAETELRKIMNKYPETRTPLFISYYREIQSLSDSDKKDVVRRNNLTEYSRRINYAQINNYYDLFSARTMLLAVNAEEKKFSPEWYYSVLPALAYYMYRTDQYKFGKDTIEMLFEGRNGISDKSDKNYVFRWISNEIHNGYNNSLDNFEFMNTDEKVAFLLNTGIIKPEVEEYNGGTYSGEYTINDHNTHFEYIQFLAALFISKVYRKIDSEKMKDKVLEELAKRTSYIREDNELSRVDRVRNIPLAYYTVMDIYEHTHKTEEVAFEPFVYRIAANAAFEGKDVWSQTEQLSDALFKYYRGTIKLGNPEVKAFEDWKLIESASELSYNHITKSRDDEDSKWELLEKINTVLNNAAAVIMRKTFRHLRKTLQFTENAKRNWNTWDETLAVSNMESLLNLMEKTGPFASLGPFPANLIGKIYSNIGAVNQEMAKFAYYNKGKTENNDKYYLGRAKEFHDLSMRFRELVFRTMPEEAQNISVIRSCITLATDAYYEAKFTNYYEETNRCINEAVEYYNTALLRQGLDYHEFKDYDYNLRFPIIRTEEIVEICKVDEEPFVICPRAAGAWHLLYLKTKDAMKDADAVNDEKMCMSLNNLLTDLVRKQYDYLKAAYLFLVEECYDYGKDGKTLVPNTAKLELNTHEIDLLYEDAKLKYEESFRLLKDRNDGKTLLENIEEMFLALHPHYSKRMKTCKEWQEWLEK